MKDSYVSVVQDFLKTFKPSTAAKKSFWIQNPIAKQKLCMDSKILLDFFDDNQLNPELSFVAQTWEADQLILFTDSVHRYPNQFTGFTQLSMQNQR